MEIPKGYKVECTGVELSDTEKEMIQYLQNIVLDRSIPEKNKVDIKKQLNEIIRMKQIVTKPTFMLVKE